MDEEDLREAEEARQLQIIDAFAGLGPTEDDSARLGGLIDVLRISGETMGSKLLKRMGWREGQGIGPMVRRTANLGVQEDGPLIGEKETHLFAPPNPAMISFARKKDQKGLGFAGDERLNDNTLGAAIARTSPQRDLDDEERGLPITANRSRRVKKAPATRGGFGVGIMNDTGSDDEDPYQIGPQISYNRVIGGDKKQKKRPMDSPRSSIASSNPLLKSKPIYHPKKTMATTTASSFQRCHDGRLPLESFVLSRNIDTDRTSEQDGLYPPPPIPPEWRSAKAPPQDRSHAPYVSTADAAKASSLDARSRAALLGETQLPGKSVFDYLTAGARDRIVTASGRTNLPAALGETAPEGYEMTVEGKARELLALVPKLDSDVALQALSRGGVGWMPYADDENKQTRYRTFLEICAGMRDGIPEMVPGVAKDSWTAELHEFARAAQVFRPVTGMMASRFTSSTSQPHSTSGALEQDARSTSLLKVPVAKIEHPAEVAAKMGMFGPMTRSIGRFYPTRLLCKRFNVKPPAHVQLDPGSGPTEGAASERHYESAGSTSGATATSELVPIAVINQLMLESGGSTKAANDMHGSGQTPTEQPDKLLIDAERNEALESERPGEAVFKAIFGDSEDEEN